jgi:hypothetical protein
MCVYIKVKFKTPFALRVEEAYGNHQIPTKRFKNSFSVSTTAKSTS